MTTKVAKQGFTSHRNNIQPWVDTNKSVIGKHFSQKGQSENNISFLVIEDVKNKNCAMQNELCSFPNCNFKCIG